MNSTDFFPSKLWAVANACERSAPKLNIGEIRQKILQKQTQKISHIEWFWLVTNKKAWKDLKCKESQQLAIEVWVIALEFYTHNCPDNWLLKELSHRLLRQDKQQKLAPALIKAWDDFSINQCPVKSKFIFQVLKVVYGSQGYTLNQELLKLLYQDKLLPSQFSKKVDHILPKLNCFNQYLYQFADFFLSIKPINENDIQFFIGVIEDIQNHSYEDQEIKIIDKCLTKWSVDFFDDQHELRQWFIDSYHRTPKKSKLSSQAITKLSQIIGLQSYQIFDYITQSVIDNILSKDYAYDDRKRNKETNKLSKRRDFWKNYTDSFISITVFLPRRTFSLISQENIPLQAPIYMLEDDGSEESEVCIFELKNNLLIVEIFRGKGNDLRIFAGHYRNQLLNNSSLSIQKIRALGGQPHDHVVLWQYFCEQLLRTQYGICPNQNIVEFYGVPRKHAMYSHTKGLPKPQQRGLDEREGQLDQWMRYIKNLEEQACRKYPSL